VTKMADKESEKYELGGTATAGETIALTVNGTTVYSETVPVWATSGAIIYFRVQFSKTTI